MKTINNVNYFTGISYNIPFFYWLHHRRNLQSTVIISRNFTERKIIRFILKIEYQILARRYLSDFDSKIISYIMS